MRVCVCVCVCVCVYVCVCVLEGESISLCTNEQASSTHTDTHTHPLTHTDPGSNNSGYYELTAVLTHQGRSSSSGHYVGWVSLKNGQSHVTHVTQL